MNISKEFKIGIVVTASIGLFIWGFNFLKGHDIFSHKYELYAVYPKIDGLIEANPLLIKDESLTNLSAQLTAAFTPSLGATLAGAYGAIFGQARQATATDLVLLPTQGAIGAAPTASDSGLGVAPAAPLNKFGITFPLQDKHLLVPTEIAEIKAATDSYNTTIQAAAIANNLAFVDAKSVMNLLSTTGINFDTYNMTSTYVTGGSFSLDGVHPSARGYALITNMFIDAINAKYGSTLKKKDGRNFQILYPKVIN